MIPKARPPPYFAYYYFKFGQARIISRRLIMVKAINSGLTKKIMMVLMAIITMITCFGVSASAASYVETMPVLVKGEYYSNTFTIPSTDNILSMSFRAYAATGQPKVGHIRLQKKVWYGWSTVKECDIGVDNNTITPWGVFSVNPNEQYQIQGTMKESSSSDASFKLVVSFSSGNA